MKDDILVSICIPAFNASKFIKETLESVKNQSYRNWELVVVEDGSFDGTKEIVESFAKKCSQKIIYFRNTANKGLSATRNISTQISKGEWIAFLDSDDLWHEDHLSDLVDAASRHCNCDLIHSGAELFDNRTGKIISSRFPSSNAVKTFPNSLFSGVYIIQPSSVMITRRLFNATGGFNESFTYVEDLEMWLRCAKAGFKFFYSGRNTCYYRKHSEAMTANVLALAIGTANVYEAFSDWDVIPKRIRKNRASKQWFALARIARSKDKRLSKMSLTQSMKHRWTIKGILYWILLSAS